MPAAAAAAAAPVCVSYMLQQMLQELWESELDFEAADYENLLQAACQVTMSSGLKKRKKGIKCFLFSHGLELHRDLCSHVIPEPGRSRSA